MASKTPDNSQWTDPKDYGLPFVEITPLIPVPESQEKMSPKEDSIQKSELSISETDPKADSMFLELEPATKPEKVHVEPIEKKVDPEKKSSNLWVWIVAILAVAIVGVISYQIRKESNLDTIIITPDEEVNALENDQNQEALDLKNTPSQEIQPSENQQIIADSVADQITPPQTPQTGTTIESNRSGSLVRIESKKERPQYFIVIGSLASERLAVKEAAQYYDRAQTLYLILPYEDNKNYRLAIGAFGSFSSAAAELERAKGLYSEDLWILKH